MVVEALMVNAVPIELMERLGSANSLWKSKYKA